MVTLAPPTSTGWIAIPLTPLATKLSTTAFSFEIGHSFEEAPDLWHWASTCSVVQRRPVPLLGKWRIEGKYCRLDQLQSGCLQWRSRKQRKESLPGGQSPIMAIATTDRQTMRGDNGRFGMLYIF